MSRIILGFADVIAYNIQIKEKYNERDDRKHSG